MTDPTRQIGAHTEKLLALAECVEALPHLNRTLNAEISAAMGEQFNHAFTSSLDAAKIIVPEGYLWCAGISETDDGHQAWANVRSDSDGNFDCSVNAATPEIALTAAALRARAAQ